MTPAKITAVKPTTIETRAPKISRDSTSRPSWSVPSRWFIAPPACQNGGLKRAVRLPTSGLCGARTSAKIAVKAITPRMMIGINGRSPNPRIAERDGSGDVRTMVSLDMLMRHLSTLMRGSITA